MYIIWNVEFNTIFFEKMCLLSPLNAKYKAKDMPVCILPTCLTSISHLGLFFLSGLFSQSRWNRIRFVKPRKRIFFSAPFSSNWYQKRESHWELRQLRQQKTQTSCSFYYKLSISSFLPFLNLLILSNFFFRPLCSALCASTLIISLFLFFWLRLQLKP